MSNPPGIVVPGPPAPSGMTGRSDAAVLPIAVPAVPDDLDALWLRVSGPARVETLHAGRQIAVTTIDARGGLVSCADPDASAEQLAAHADALAAALAARVAGVQAVLSGVADGPALVRTIHAWLVARVSTEV